MAAMSDPKKTAVPEDPSRRDFLRAGVAAGLVAAARPAAAGPAAQAPSPPRLRRRRLLAAPPLERVRIGYVGVGRRGTDPPGEPAPDRGRGDPRRVRHRPREGRRRRRPRWSPRSSRKPAGYSSGRARLRAPVRRAGPGPRLHRHAVGVARAGPARRDERTASTRSTEVPAAVTDRGVLGSSSRSRRSCRRHCVMMENCCYGRTRAADPRPSCARVVLRRAPPRPRAATSHDLRRIKFENGRRGPVAPRALRRAQRQPLPHSRPGPRRPVHGHQPRRTASTTWSR